MGTIRLERGEQLTDAQMGMLAMGQDRDSQNLFQVSKINKKKHSDFVRQSEAGWWLCQGYLQQRERHEAAQREAGAEEIYPPIGQAYSTLICNRICHPSSMPTVMCYTCDASC